MKFCWTTINVKDMDQSIAFYQDIVGLSLNRRVRATAEKEIAFLGEGDTQVELIHNAQATSVSFGKDIFMGFAVDSLDQTIEMLNSKAIPIVSGPFQPIPMDLRCSLWKT
jgi:lactoylglutathione lyase